MDFLPYSQEYMLIVSVMSGMILGFIWDIYRLLRHYVRFGVICTAAGDMLYWIFSVFFSIMIIEDISYGNVRLFIILGFLLGALIYFYGVSRYILKCFIFIVDSILFFIKKLFAFMIFPLKYVAGKIKIILYPFKIKAVNERDKAKRRYKFLKFRIKKVFKNKKMLYNKKKQSRKKNIKKYR